MFAAESSDSAAHVQPVPNVWWPPEKEKQSSNFVQMLPNSATERKSVTPKSRQRFFFFFLHPSSYRFKGRWDSPLWPRLREKDSAKSSRQMFFHAGAGTRARAVVRFILIARWSTVLRRYS